MHKLSEDALPELFNERTYERGLEYYENGHVLKPSRLNDTVYAKVIGNAPDPYEVGAKLSGEDTYTWCSCPVGSMCKHGVALLLKWIREPETFSDRGKIFQALESKSKEELLGIIKNAINEHPYLIDELKIRSEGTKGQTGANAGILIKKIKRIASNDDYDYPDSIVQKLDDIKDSADALMEDGQFADASRVYLELVRAGLKIFGDFIEDDDTGQKVGDLMDRSIKGFNESAPHVDGAEKEKLIGEIFYVIGLDEWGMDVEELFYGVITAENIGLLEARLIGGSREHGGEGAVCYSMEGGLDLLGMLYERLGMPGEKIRLAGSRLDDKEDYARLSNALRYQGKFEEALDIAAKGLRLEESASIALDEAYFKAAYLVAEKDIKIVDFVMTVNVAKEILSRRFDISVYNLISDVFRLMGRYKDFTDAVPSSRINKESLIKALLHSGDIEKAVAMASAGKITDDSLTAEVAEAAAKKGMMKESALLAASLVLQRRPYELNFYRLTDRLLDVMAGHLDAPELNKVCEHAIKANLSDLAVELMPRIEDRYPEMAMRLVARFGRETPASAIYTVALAIGKKKPEEGLRLCRGKIKGDLLTSHSHYDDAILLLKAMKKLYESEGRASDWTVFIRKFSSDNKGKKKLIGKLKVAFGDDLH